MSFANFYIMLQFALLQRKKPAVRLSSCFPFAAVCAFLLFSLSACQGSTAAPRWHWERAETGLPRQAIVTAVAGDPADFDQLWAGLYDTVGLATSSDGGQTWQIGAAGLNDNPVFDLLVTSGGASSADRSVWAATRDGLLVSRAADRNWYPAAATLPRLPALAVAADATGRVYVGLDGAGIYAEAEDRLSWISLSPPQSPPTAADDSQPQPVANDNREAAAIIATAAVISLAVSPDGRQLYAGTPGQGVFASRDAGRTWQVTYSGDYVPNVALNPRSPNVAVASLRNRLVRTRDGGQSWHTLPLSWAKDEIVSLLWLPDGTLGAGTGQGRLFRSLDNGDSWLQGGDGLPAGGGVLDLNASASSGPTGQQLLLAGTWTGIFGSRNGGQSWSQLAPELGRPFGHALLATDTGLMLGARTGLYRWQPDSYRWTPVPANLPSGVSTLVANPVDGRVLYAGTEGHGLFQSNDAGQGWIPLPALIAGIPAVAVDPKDPEHIYILAAWERVYETLNGGQSWLARWDGLGKVIETTALAVDPVEPIAYVGTETGLFRSDNGQAWTLTAPALADQSILALYIYPGSPEAAGEPVLYIGTTQGVYQSLDNGETVQGNGQGDGAWGQGLEDISVTALLADPAAPERLYAGTAYAGVYQSVDSGRTWQAVGPAELTDGVIEGMAWGPNRTLFVVSTSGVWRGEQVE